MLSPSDEMTKDQKILFENLRPGLRAGWVVWMRLPNYVRMRNLRITMYT